MNKIKMNWGYYLVLALCFYISPFFMKDTGTAMLLLLSVIPIICFVLSVLNGMNFGFNLSYLLGVPVIFIPSIYIFYNSSAWIYVAIYFVIALIGNWIGCIF